MHNNRRVRSEGGKYALNQGSGKILDRHPGITSKSPKKDAWARQIGTLGGGNHFIEICLDEADRVWIMLHSGSRGIGNKIGQYFISKAKEVIAKTDIQLPDSDLAYLTEGSGLFTDYWHALTWAQEYAARNRQEMLDIVIEALGRSICRHSNSMQRQSTVTTTTRPGNGTRRHRNLCYPKGCDPCRSRRAGNHSGLNGCSLLHRSWQGQ